jgi:hypothetical protein
MRNRNYTGKLSILSTKTKEIKFYRTMPDFFFRPLTKTDFRFFSFLSGGGGR